MNIKSWGLAIGLALAAAPALAAGIFTNGLPAAPNPPSSTYQFPLDTEISGGAPPQSAYMTLGALSGAIGAQGGTGGWRNALIGGDFTSNLFQRTTTGTGITSTLTYTADRWAAIGAAGSSISWAKETAAADITTAFGASLRFQRAAANADVNAICIAQTVETNASFRFQGQRAEFAFHALLGANFSGASNLINASIITGTGTNEGTASMLAGTWAGSTVATTAVTASTTWGRYGVIATAPAGTTEIGVKLCYTPVGTAGTNDWFEFTGAQLATDPAGVAITSQSGAGVAGSLLSFERRPIQAETALQQRYFYRLTETAAVTPIAPCSAVDTTHTNCLIQFPVSMRAAPTMTYATGFASPTSTTQATLGNCSALASAATVASTVANPLNVLVNCTATTIPAAGVASFLYSNGGTGTISAAAEL